VEGGVLRRAFLLWREAMKRPTPKAPAEKAARDVALGGRRSSLSFGGDIVGDWEVDEVVGGGVCCLAHIKSK
jgi:hypothetical protein